ncbi:MULTISPECIES: hypothetical protein [Clostridium]|uniref:hypothetical protein n=1 Tax=Clostridium TaxID=1485 RepID=UPI000ADD6142|nr:MULTISPECIES: hypothetical protein [Clostridium]MCD2345065.1 hypothetical protein [Clostridium guangxiense]
MIRKILYYFITLIAWLIATLYLPFYLCKNHEKHDFWYLEIGKYYSSIKTVVGMFIIG